jgi:hypothetical protein
MKTMWGGMVLFLAGACAGSPDGPTMTENDQTFFVFADQRTGEAGLGDDPADVATIPGDLLPDQGVTGDLLAVDGGGDAAPGDLVPELAAGQDLVAPDLKELSLPDLGGPCTDKLELCNGVDDDCDGLVDEEFPDTDLDGVADCIDWDDDGDGVADTADCQPLDPDIHPQAEESCNGIDDDCDGTIDGEGAVGCTPYFPDEDDDTFGANGSASQCLCEPVPPWTSPFDLDCDDGNPEVNPLAPEQCNQFDDNCNGVVDEGVCYFNCEDALDCLPGWACNPETGICYSLECLAVWEPGDFEPAEEWAWTGSTDSPSHNQVMASPSVADLDGDELPEIVFVCFQPGQYNNNGVVRAIHGDGSGELFTLTGHPVYGGAMPALADFTGDGLPDIVVTAQKSTGGLHAWSSSGEYLWSAGSGQGDPSIADLNGDGTPEVVTGYEVISPAGQLLWSAVAESANAHHKVSVADLDGDGFLDLTLGGKAVSPFSPECPDVPCGKVLWDSGQGGGFTAIADLDGNGTPEVVVAAQSHVTARDGLTGQPLWSVPVPGTGGGAPNIADFDGDGGVEIGIAGKAAYSVFDGLDGAVLWTKTTQDFSSSSTGSSVFDFDGDGKAEVVYNDELTLRIYSGPTGDVVWSTPNGSGTLFEYPVIVDVDNDHNAEIVVASNDYAYGSHHGVRIFGDATDHWVSTRRIWNQHAYHITHVNEDGTLPMAEEPSWLAHNTYRCNLQMDYDPLASPDLSADELPFDTVACPEEMLVSVLVRNTGTLSVPAGLEVAFYAGAPGEEGTLQGTLKTGKELPPGSEVTLVFHLAAPELPEMLEVKVVIDPNGKVSECHEDNNEVVITGPNCIKP